MYNKINFKDYGSSLVSRLHGREIFKMNHGVITNSKIIVLDFDGVNMITLSFATEFFDSLFFEYKNCFEIKNANDYIQNAINFALNNAKKPNELHFC